MAEHCYNVWMPELSERIQFHIDVTGTGPEHFYSNWRAFNRTSSEIASLTRSQQIHFAEVASCCT